MELGIIGLPTSGKTTVFNALTRADRPTTAASTGRSELFSMVVDVPDERVERLSAMYHPHKTTHAKVTYVDIAGLDQNLGKTGLSGQLRNHIAPMDAFVHVIRAFEDERIPHPLGSVDPRRDLQTMDEEFLLADLITVENHLERIAEALKKGARGAERQALFEEEKLFQRLREALSDNVPLRDLGLSADEKGTLRGYGLLTLKPVLVLLNLGDETEPPALSYSHRDSAVMTIRGKLEMELSQLDPDEAAMFMEEFGIQTLAAARIIRASYQLLGLLSFFTVGEKEVRAWELPVGSTAFDAAAAIHTDMARGFIRAEVVAYDDLIAAGSMAAARKAGKVHLEGREYKVQDGDILYIRFST